MTEDTFEQILNDIINKGGFPFSADKSFYDKDANIIWLPVRSGDFRFGKRHIEEISNALNHLIRKIVEVQSGPTSLVPSLIVDIDGIERKNIENLRALAHMMAERSKFFKSSIELDPMPPRSRKIIHEYLAERPNVRTSSTGEGLKRHIVIEYYDSPSDSSL